MKALLVSLLAAATLCQGQQKTPQRPQASPKEQEELETALSEAASSPVEYLRAIEKHLEKYPDSPRKAELERAAARAAMEVNDDRRILLYGERVLARQPDDLQILERVIRALLSGDPKTSSERGLKYARRYEELVRRMQRDSERSGSAASGPDWKMQTDRAIARALTWEARATGNLGRPEEALALARRAFETDPSAEPAREISHWYERLGKPAEAARALADAFTIPDPHTTDADRARDRGRMGELYHQAKGSEAGLGDLVLEAYDRNVALIHTRELKMRANDPNAQLTDPMDFTLSGPDGARLSMAGLKGKVVVFDFWATWCGPCRTQHPLYDRVKQQFRNNPAVVFLSIDTDEDPNAVKPFLAEVQWTEPVYFEDGLSRALKVTSIPTTVVIDRSGKIFSRLNGFVPERFVEMLGQRIRDALGN
ncbi:MAG TPA: TlpA disulfide reductase family protein [Bryobacteraceae bacterium]|nr:TlpA disulfide reductase family protein [Bryobacteraceae bacterium]